MKTVTDFALCPKRFRLKAEKGAPHAINKARRSSAALDLDLARLVLSEVL